MNFFKTVFFTLLLSVLSFSSNAEEKLRVLDKGMDGKERYYLITCPDGNRSSVTVKYNLPDEPLPESSEDDMVFTPAHEVKVIETCMSSHSGKYECKSTWSLDEAAKASCP